MIYKIRPFRATLLAALLCGASSVSLLAQGPGGPPHGGPGAHHGPPPSPLFDALDTNHDGVLSAEEISNASASLKALLKDGATQLTLADLRPAPPHHEPAVEEAVADNDHPGGKRPMIRPHGPPPAPAEAGVDAPDNAAPEPAGPPAESMDHPHHHGPPPDVDQARGEMAGRPAPDRSGPPRDDARPVPDADPERHPHHGPPHNPLFDALDANHDGVISTEEMNNASTSLKELLKKGTSELRRDDLRPEHAPHHPGEGPHPDADEAGR